MFAASTLDDVDTIQSWTDADDYHHGQNNPIWWITGNGSFLAGCIKDDEQTVFFFRLDREESLMRLNIQFAPASVISKKQVATALVESFPKIVELTKSIGLKGMIFASTSPSLISFLSRLGFEPKGEDFVKMFEEQ